MQTNAKTVDFIAYPILLLVLLWTIYFGDKQLHWELYRFGVHPRSLIGLVGIIMMPLIHSTEDIHHLLNNSLPILILFSSLIYFYRELALRVFLIIWLGTGFFVWISADGGYHIGISGVIYGLCSFLFFSGALRRYKPLMGLSLFVIFIYGSLIWGIFPLKEHVSWEGHLFGLGIGVILAFIYKKQGPQSPKLNFELEEEQGIQPPDLEAKWRELNQ